MTQKEKILLQFSEKKNVSVELGIVQDFIQDYKKAVDTFTSAESLMDSASEQLKSAKSTYVKIESQAKALGVDLDNTVKKLGSNLDSFIKSSAKR